VQWDNAYTTPATVTEGQAALEPGNEMQRITVDGAYHFSTDMRATASVALGRMTQNVDFLPYTVNGSLSLPRSSLGGEVNTFNSTFRLNYRRNEDWNYSVQYRHNEQDNDTPIATYNYVVADFQTTLNPRRNFPYSFREKEFSLQGRYQIDTQHQINLNYEHAMGNRTFQEVDSSDEDTFSAVYRSEFNEQLQWFLRLKTSNRKGSYMSVAEIFPPEDILLRKYNLANRVRNSAGLSLSWTLSDRLQMSAYGDYASDDYSDSDIGLQESRQAAFSLELQYQVSDILNINVDYSTTNIDSSQAGTIWSADNKDRMNVLHGAANYELKKYKLLLGVDIALANSIGDITVSSGDGFPSLKATRKTISLFADYSLSDRSVVHAFFGYEDYDEENWAIDGVVPNTLNNVLTLGEVSPSYDIGMFAISYKTKF
jgi:MtrB/PioB family decaheme-associated outer membrane protein